MIAFTVYKKSSEYTNALEPSDMYIYNVQQRKETIKIEDCLALLKHAPRRNEFTYYSRGKSNIRLAFIKTIEVDDHQESKGSYKSYRDIN